MISSVIQGSVLGSTLFNMFINDIIEIIEAFARIFADDTKVARTIRNEEDQKAMQDDITRLREWAEEWKMSFNVDKCKVMHVGKHNPRTEYKMNGVSLSETTLEKDLGVWTDSSWKPGSQCDAAAKKANAMLGQIARKFHYRKKATLIPLYKTFVRPHLEYAVAAWSPWTVKDIETLEKVQKRFVKMLSDVRGSTYEERIAEADLLTLKERRWRGDIIETFKTMKGINQVNKNEWFEIREDDNVRSTRANVRIENETETRRSDIIYKERSRLEIRKNFYTSRVAREWNRLPEWIKDRKTTNSFKNALDRWRANGGKFELTEDETNSNENNQPE